MKIGIAGTGRMGTATAQRLLELGHEVRVWNRSVDNANDAREAGARWAPSLGELANDSQVVISFLFDDPAVERVYLGTDGFLTGRLEGRLFIDMSTVRLGCVRCRHDAQGLALHDSGSGRPRQLAAAGQS